jgi:hypothetical protein
MTTATRMQLGQIVQFRDHQRLIKPAMVTAARESIDPARPRSRYRRCGHRTRFT